MQDAHRLKNARTWSFMNVEGNNLLIDILRHEFIQVF